MKTDDPGTPIADLEGITFIRQGKTILDGIDWTILRGEHWALLGANGAGKTTLLKILTGYEWPTRGAVTAFGNRYGQCVIQEVRKRIGWVSSSLAFHVPPRDTAAEVVLSGFDASLGLYREYSGEQIAAAAHAIDAVGLAPHADQNYGTLSQGERQRVMIARALVGKPGLLILDEPCAGLDPRAREDLLDDLADLSGRSDAPTIILVTHHVEEVAPFITHAAIMGPANIIASGAKENVMTSEHFTTAFDRPAEIDVNDGRYYLRFPN